jgi:multimeric flavodoxin WrbA
MKCLIINGSPSTAYYYNGETVTGFTARIAARVVGEMKTLGEVETEEVALRDLGLAPCRGCYNCFNIGEARCPYFEKVGPLFQKLREADCVIITSPVYALQVSAFVKCFFELGAYNFHRPSFFEKKALVISSTAGAAARTACDYMADVLGHWGFNSVYKLPVTRFGANEIGEKLAKRCRRAAERLYRAAASSKLRQPSLKRLVYFQAWKAMSAMESATPPDRSHWEAFGAAPYSPIVPLSPPKRLFSNALGGLLKKIFAKM